MSNSKTKYNVIHVKFRDQISCYSCQIRLHWPNLMSFMSNYTLLTRIDVIHVQFNVLGQTSFHSCQIRRSCPYSFMQHIIYHSYNILDIICVIFVIPAIISRLTSLPLLHYLASSTFLLIASGQFLLSYKGTSGYSCVKQNEEQLGSIVDSTILPAGSCLRRSFFLLSIWAGYTFLSFDWVCIIICSVSLQFCPTVVRLPELEKVFSSASPKQRKLSVLVELSGDKHTLDDATTLFISMANWPSITLVSTQFVKTFYYQLPAAQMCQF
jgi:hypothetical protein